MTMKKDKTHTPLTASYVEDVSTPLLGFDPDLDDEEAEEEEEEEEEGEEEDADTPEVSVVLDAEETTPRKAAASPKARIVQIPEKALKAIRQAAAAKATAKAQASFTASLGALGFASLDEVKDFKEQGQKMTTSAKDADALQKKLDDTIAEAAAKQTELLSQLDAAKKDTELQIASVREQYTLKDLAVSAAVVDPDIALSLLAQHRAGLSEEDLKEFSAEKYFSETLKAAKPWLYTATTPTAPVKKPASTGPKGPGPSPETGEDVVDTLNMSPEEYRKYKQSKRARLGLN